MGHVVLSADNNVAVSNLEIQGKNIIWLNVGFLQMSLFCFILFFRSKAPYPCQSLIYTMSHDQQDFWKWLVLDNDIINPN